MLLSSDEELRDYFDIFRHEAKPILFHRCAVVIRIITPWPDLLALFFGVLFSGFALRIATVALHLKLPRSVGCSWFGYVWVKAGRERNGRDVLHHAVVARASFEQEATQQQQHNTLHLR